MFDLQKNNTVMITKWDDNEKPCLISGGVGRATNNKQEKVSTASYSKQGQKAKEGNI